MDGQSLKAMAIVHNINDKVIKDWRNYKVCKNIAIVTLSVAHRPLRDIMFVSNRMTHRFHGYKACLLGFPWLCSHIELHIL